MNHQYLTPAIITGAAMLALSQSVLAEEAYSGTRTPDTPITSLDQAQAIADFGVNYFPGYAAEHEGYFTNTAQTIAIEVTSALNAEPAVFPKEKASTSNFLKRDAERERRKDHEKHRISKSLADGLKRSQSYQYQVDLSVSCQHSGNYTITNVRPKVAYENDDSRPIDLLVNYVNCIDYYSDVSYSIERNGPVQIRVIPLVSGKIVTRQVAFGNSNNGTSYTVSYTHVPTQRLVTRWSANYSVIGRFVPTQVSDTGLPLGNYSYVIDGRINEWYLIGYDNKDYEVDFDLVANQVKIFKSNTYTAGVDESFGTEDDMYRTETTYHNGGMELSLVGYPGDTQPVKLAYTFNDIKYLDKTDLYNMNRSLSVFGGLTYSFPYFANPVCTNGTYSFFTTDPLRYDNNFSYEFPILGSQIVNRSVAVQYGQDSNSDIIMTVMLNGQSGAYNISRYGIQRCFN